MINWGAVKRYPGIYLTAEETYGKPQLGDRLIKAVSVIGSIVVSYHQMTVGSHSTAQHIRGEEGGKEWRGIFVPSTLKN